MAPDAILHTVYCPRCDRPYTGTTRKSAEDRAKIHVDGQHPDMDNPFREEGPI